ncbi:hypothetical protein GBAR_LOCUS23939, partial [Geodia barretti]
VGSSRGLSLTSRLDSPPSTPLGQGNVFHGSSPSSISSAGSEIAGISAKLDQVLAAFSGQSQLLAETKQEGINQREQLVVLSAELKELKETVTTLKHGSILSQSSKESHLLYQLRSRHYTTKLLMRCSSMAQNSRFIESTIV